MQVVRKDPGKPPVITQVKNTLEALQQAVGGPIETVTLARDAAIICNEEGWLRDLPFNCRFCRINFVGHDSRGWGRWRGIFQPEQ